VLREAPRHIPLLLRVLVQLVDIVFEHDLHVPPFHYLAAGLSECCERDLLLGERLRRLVAQPAKDTL
jgi:hypothetical protein